MDQLPPIDWDDAHEQLRALVEKFFAADPVKRAEALQSLALTVEKRKRLQQLTRN